MEHEQEWKNPGSQNATLEHGASLGPLTGLILILVLYANSEDAWPFR